MWVNAKIVSWFGLNVELVHTLQADLAVARAERDSLKLQAAINQNNFEWARLQINALEVERASLMERVHNIRMPIPELTRPMRPLAETLGSGSADDLFTDMGEERAKKLGLPLYGN